MVGSLRLPVASLARDELDRKALMGHVGGTIIGINSDCWSPEDVASLFGPTLGPCVMKVLVDAWRNEFKGRDVNGRLYRVPGSSGRRGPSAPAPLPTTWPAEKHPEDAMTSTRLPKTQWCQQSECGATTTTTGRAPAPGNQRVPPLFLRGERAAGPYTWCPSRKPAVTSSADCRVAIFRRRLRRQGAIKTNHVSGGRRSDHLIGRFGIIETGHGTHL
jgi:hypothetical protein